MHELLSIDQMYEADRLANSDITKSIDLMENAGVRVVEIINQQWPQVHNVTVLCGPGNNGGDGYVIARLLAGQGCSVRLINVVPGCQLKGDAAIAAQLYEGLVESWSKPALVNTDLIVDAMFGAGLSRNVAGDLKQIVVEINQANTPIISIDIPTGINGDSGDVCGSAVKADHTVTFFRRKPGHILFPGRSYCGELHVKNIGIPSAILATIKPNCYANEPELWRECLPQETPDQHKYTRGHVLAISGGRGKTGACRLAARAALRAGAGLVTVASPPQALDENAAQLTAIMVKEFSGESELHDLLQDKRITGCVIGPGAGVNEQTRRNVEVILNSAARTVIDADGMTSFADHGQTAALFDAIKKQPQRDVVLTPHQGEFNRLFGKLAGNKLDATRKAAVLTGAIIVFKGPDTVIATPDGMAAINANAPASLATAGSGDVLAGIISGLMARKMPGFYAACAGVWIHARAASLFGPGLIAEDLTEMLPKVWNELL